MARATSLPRASLSTLFAEPFVQVGDQWTPTRLAGSARRYLGGVAVDVALDVEQGVDALHGLQADRRQHRRSLALRRPARAARDVGQHEELPACMCPAGGLPGSGRAVRPGS